MGILQKLASGEDPYKAFHDAADAAGAGAVATKTMLAQVLYVKRLNPVLRFTYLLFVFVSRDLPVVLKLNSFLIKLYLMLKFHYVTLALGLSYFIKPFHHLCFLFELGNWSYSFFTAMFSHAICVEPIL